jgi:hypothetical protein
MVSAIGQTVTSTCTFTNACAVVIFSLAPAVAVTVTPHGLIGSVGGAV